MNPSGINNLLEAHHQYNLRVKEQEGEAEQHSVDYLRGYLARHDNVGAIRGSIRAVWRALDGAENPRIEAYRNVLKRKTSPREQSC